MSKRWWIGLMLLGVTHLAATAQDFAHYKLLFWQQLSETCRPNVRWEKSVTEVAEDGTEAKETKLFDVDCYHGKAVAGETTIPLLKDEFSQIFEFAYDNPYCSPYLDIQKNATGVTATVKPGEEGKSKLRLQKFVIDPATGKLQMAETHIVKGSALYDMEVHFVVLFDAAGHYQSHTVETKTDVLLGGEVHTKIQARIVP